MKYTEYLYLTKKGMSRRTKTPQRPSMNEVRVEVNFTVPDALFERPQPRIDVVVSGEYDQHEVIELDLTDEVTVATIRAALGDVKDGILSAIADEGEGSGND